MGRFKFPHIEEPSIRVQTLRYFMTLFCFFFIVFGIGITTCSAALAAGRPAKCRFLGRYFTGVYMLLAAGCGTTFFSLLSCFHARRISSSRSFIPACNLVVVMIVMQIFAAITGHVFTTRARDGGLKSAMNSTWREYEQERGCVDGVQRDFRCCGALGDWEWLALSVNVGEPSPYPASCMCSTEGDNCAFRNGTFANSSYAVHVFTDSCHDAVVDYVFNTLLVPRIVGPVLSVVETVLGLTAFYIVRHIDTHSLVGVYVVRTPGEGTAPVRDQSEERNIQEGGAETVREQNSHHESLSISRDETVMHI